MRGRHMKRWIILVIMLMLNVNTVAFCGALPSVQSLFELNDACIAEGYYMAEFEFKMLGLIYYLDRGQFLKALIGLTRFQQQLEKREGLINVSEFQDKAQEYDAFRNLQNPKTGAFMDDFYPQCAYHGPTENVLEHLEALASELGKPLCLKYPLKYLDEINTPRKLVAFLDDLAAYSSIATSFPQTPYHNARDILSLVEEGNIIERNGLYSFSAEWKQVLLRWFYENQDSETGLWGPRLKRNGELFKLDLQNTSSIVKVFVDRSGKDIYPDFPLRFKDKMFATAIDVLSEEAPEESATEEWHEWGLVMDKGISLLTRYIWEAGTEEDKGQAADILKFFGEILFEKMYIPSEGAFSYYPGGRASLEGAGSVLGFYSDTGVFSPPKQLRLWGGAEKTCVRLEDISVSALTEKDVVLVKDQPDVNAWRYYAEMPTEEGYIADAKGVFYPEPVVVGDVVHVIPQLKKWVQNTDLSIGNWVSRERLMNELSEIPIETVPVSIGEMPLEELNHILNLSGSVTLIGFDALQVPRYQRVFQSHVQTIRK